MAEIEEAVVLPVMMALSLKNLHKVAAPSFSIHVHWSAV